MNINVMGQSTKMSELRRCRSRQFIVLDEKLVMVGVLVQITLDQLCMYQSAADALGRIASEIDWRTPLQT